MGEQPPAMTGRRGGLLRQRARARNRPVELVFRSASPGLLGLPWELLAAGIIQGRGGSCGLERGEPGEALAWMVRCVALIEVFPQLTAGPGPRHLARLTADLGIPALESIWQQAAGHPLPEAVRGYVLAHSDTDKPA